MSVFKSYDRAVAHAEAEAVAWESDMHILRLTPWAPGEPSQQLIRVLARGIGLSEPDRFAEPEMAEFIWRTSHGVTGNFKRLLHWSQRVARDTHGREHVELSDVYEAARLFPCYIDR